MTWVGRGQEGEEWSSRSRAVSTAPFVCLLRILERCWKERQALSADLTERIREQLEGPLGLKAKADERVLEVMEGFEPHELEALGEAGWSDRERALLGRLGKAELERRRIRP